MIRGMDISSLAEVEQCGGKFFDGGREMDLLQILKSYGVNYIRLRLWNDPYAEDGSPYGAGCSDFGTTLSLAKRALLQGFGFLLDLHYSDFWADPGKQTVPKAWRGLDAQGLEQAVYDFTKRTLEDFRAAGAMPTMVAVGNELSNGLLWPYGKTPHYNTIASLVSAGIRAVRDVDGALSVMLHLDNGGDNDLYRRWFDNYFANGGEDFEWIGLSYYPFWHGNLAVLEANMQDIAVRYKKDLIVAEVSMGFTMDDYQEYEGLCDAQRKGYATKPELTAGLDYPMTKQGQADFMYDLMTRIRKVPQQRGKGFFYWEPAWLPRHGSEWATAAGREYIGEPGKGGNEWANQALFDYEGNALPALGVIRDFC